VWLVLGSQSFPNSGAGWRDNHVYSDAENECNWHFSVLGIQWDFPGNEALWRDVAEGRRPFVLVMSQSTGEIFSPYDGGVDLLLKSRSRAAELWLRHREWTSGEAGGL
jgi:hypothetical protein